MRNILAIESSCDETAVAVTNGRTVLSSTVLSQIEEHARFGGVVPEIASRCHIEAIVPLTNRALEQAGLTLEDIDAVAVTHAPGLIGALLVGVNFAKGLSLSIGKPLVPVHHLRSHIAANYITHPDLEPSFLSLVVSGGHTHIVEVADYTEYRLIARTADDAAGECFDKAARAMGLPYPGGIHLDRVASSYTGDEIYKLPTPRVESSELDFSFSGLKTAVVNIIHNAAQTGRTVDVPALCQALRQKVCTMLTDSTLKAAHKTGARTVAVCGGVSANSLLRAMMAERLGAQGIRVCFPDISLCGDNAAMVGIQAHYELLAGNTADLTLNAAATMSISD